MSDERRGWSSRHVDYVFRSCKLFMEHQNGKCSECQKGNEACNQVYTELKRLLQQQPEIDDMKKYVDGKMYELFTTFCRFIEIGKEKSHVSDEYILKKAKEIITQIVSDVRGGGKDGSK